jgi:hypothetical protein
MKEFLMLVVGIEMVEKMEEAQIMERVERAKTIEEKTAVVRETEKFVFEITNDVFKPDEVIGVDGVQAKEEFIQGLIAHNYGFFGLENPFKNGTTFEDVKIRNGYGVPDEFFI